MPRRSIKGSREKPLLRNDTNDSVVAEEISFREAKKNLIKAECTFYESKPERQMHPRLVIREEDAAAPWYFTHI